MVLVHVVVFICLAALSLALSLHLSFLLSPFQAVCVSSQFVLSASPGDGRESDKTTGTSGAYSIQAILLSCERGTRSLRQDRVDASVEAHNEGVGRDVRRIFAMKASRNMKTRRPM